MKVLRLTRLDGKPLLVCDGVVIEPVIQGETEPSARSRVVLGGQVRFVRESVEEVVAALVAGADQQPS